MDAHTTNHYGSICTELYEILHPSASDDELAFYLSYARTDQDILEPLCGSGRFLIPFIERGMSIRGMDSSREMIDKLIEKCPEALADVAEITTYSSDETYDYVFITSGSVGLFTDRDECRTVLRKVSNLLRPSGLFVFAVDTVACREPDDEEYRLAAQGTTRTGDLITLSSKKHYDESTRTWFMPGRYELHGRSGVKRCEEMDFQIHLYELGEIDEALSEAGFVVTGVYSSFGKTPAIDKDTEMLLYECRKADHLA